MRKSYGETASSLAEVFDFKQSYEILRMGRRSSSTDPQILAEVPMFAGMKNSMQHVAERFAVCLMLAMFIAVGCGKAPSAVPDASLTHMKVLGKLYGKCMSYQRGAYPRDETAFIAFLEQGPENWNKLAPSAKGFLSSPRNGEPLTVLYGAKVKEPVEGGFPWIAYETSSIDGARLIVNAQGTVELVDDQEFSQRVPQS
jgi:hypothetical protein